MYQPHSETSRAAFTGLEDANTKRERIRKIIEEAGYAGKTNDEISAMHDKTGSYFSPRLIELERRGLIVKLQETRRTRGGKSANVYVTPEHLNHRATCAIKPGGKKAAESLKELLRDIEANIALGTPIMAGGELHKRILKRI